MQISIITPLFNRLDLTRACLASARRTLGGWDHEWIFIDDGSTDGTRDFLRALAAEDGRVRVVLNDEPRGFAANNNHGARLARAGLLCLLNNDTVLLPGWLEPMARLARLLPDVACVGNVQREPVSGLVDHAGVYFNRAGYAQHAAKDAPAPPREDYLEWPAVTAACCVIRREVFLKLGGFDEAFHNGSEDVDFCLRARERGYRHFVANRSEIYHHISASPGRKEGEDVNLRLFRERWLGRLQTDLRTRRTVGREREEGRRYLRKHAAQPWRYNGWRWGRAVKRALWPQTPSRRLDLAPRVWFQAQDFLSSRVGMALRAVPGSLGMPLSDASGCQQTNGTARRAIPTWGTSAAGAAVFVVVGDTAVSAARTGVPTAVRNLVGALGRIGAPVQPVVWKPATHSLGLLPPEWSVGLDAEAWRVPRDPAWREASSAAVCDPTTGDVDAAGTDMPALHELPPTTVPPGAWVVLPEVLYGRRTEALVEYVHRHGWKLAVILYDVMPSEEPRFFPLGAQHEHEAYLGAVSAADLVLPVSEFAAGGWRRFVETRGLPQPPVRVCVPGADTGGWTRGVAGERRAEGGPVRILCVSAVVPRKNHRALATAFDLAVAARPDLTLELTLVGVPRLFSADNVPEAVRAFVDRHPGRVRWTEWVEYSALRKLYEECDFTVFPSELEGWGLPIVESLWRGKPCICANFGAMAETAAGGGCVTVEVRDPQALADGMLALAGEPERLAALAAEIGGRGLKTGEEYAREVLEMLG